MESWADKTQHDEVFKGCDITYVPIFLGGLMHKVSPLQKFGLGLGWVD